MADEATTTPATPETPAAGTGTTEPPEEQRVPYERFEKANKQAKEAKEQAAALQKQITDLTAAMEERESAGLPELERERKRAEQLEKRIAESETRAEQAETRALNTERSRWIATAAAAENFIDPDDASRFVDLSDIESAEDAARAVKKIAKDKKHLVKSEERQLPGQVLENGRRSPAPKPAAGGIDTTAEAESIASALKQFTQNWHNV